MYHKCGVGLVVEYLPSKQGTRVRFSYAAQMKDVNKFLLDEYKKTLVIPKVKNSQQIILAPIGLVASGKSTVIKPLSEQLNLVRISTDEIRILAKENNLALEYDLIKIVQELLTFYLGKGHSVAIDADCSDFKKRELLEIEAIEKNIKIFYIKVAPPKSWILEKIKNFKYKKGGLFANRDEAMSNFKASVKQKWPLVDLDYIYVFDTSKKNIAEQVGECVSKIKSNLE